jgi:hypothetical protein
LIRIRRDEDEVRFSAEPPPIQVPNLRRATFSVTKCANVEVQSFSYLNYAIKNSLCPFKGKKHRIFNTLSILTVFGVFESFYSVARPHRYQRICSHKQGDQMRL